jgi:uncharacterized protein (TIGR00730 family)
MNKKTSVSVFCASSAGSNPKFRSQMYLLGNLLGTQGIHVVYGGGDAGLMKALSSGVVDSGGSMTALIPEVYFDPKQVFDPNIRVLACRDAKERFDHFMASDFNIVAPGGFGSMGELGVAMTNTVDASYGEDASVQPLIFFNIDEFWDFIKNQSDKIISEGFGKERARDLFKFVEHLDDVLPIINARPIKVSRLSNI